MNLKCVSKKPNFNNLTIDKVYEGVAQGDYVLVISDNGTSQKYHRKYFTEEAENNTGRAPRRRQAPVAEVQPVLLTAAQVISRHIAIRRNNNQNEYTVALTVTQQEDAIIFAITPTTISCGVHQLRGINTVIGFINTIRDQFPHLSVVEISRELWIAVRDYFRANANGYCYIMLSTNVTEENDDYYTGLDIIASAVAVGINTNSDNRIKIWTVRIPE